MTYIKINFGSNFEDEFQKAVDEVFHLVRPAFKNYECIWRPNIDVYESVEEVIVLADMAGLNKEELHIEVDRKKSKSPAFARRFSFCITRATARRKYRTGISKETLHCPRRWTHNPQWHPMPTVF
ncbi:MAG: hypothetical protein MZV70_64910 [Desulfobacterales bacterium]|nr:hypothetical protein [Desulfobacterales bacterium]